MCRQKEKIQEDEVVEQEYFVEEQIELEELIELAENLKNAIMKLHDQEQELLKNIQSMKVSQNSVMKKFYSFISNKKMFIFGKIENEKC